MTSAEHQDIAPPIRFSRNLDLSEKRAIERRLHELQPYVEESHHLSRRLENVNRRLGIESHAAVVDRNVLELLTKHKVGLPRHIIIRDLNQPEEVIKASLKRLLRKGKVTNPLRGHWRLHVSERDPQMSERR